MSSASPLSECGSPLDISAASTAASVSSLRSHVAPLSPSTSSVPFPSASGNSSGTSDKSSHPTEPTKRAVNPRTAFQRSRRVSLPANLVQTNVHAFVSSTPLRPITNCDSTTTTSEQRPDKRISVASLASVSSFESLPEGDEYVGPSVVHIHRVTYQRSPRRGFTAPAVPVQLVQGRPFPQHRHSLPTQEHLASARQSKTSRAFSPLGAAAGQDKAQSRRSTQFESDRLSREERRWRLAVELRDTERSYVAVLEEIDRDYYQPLLAALPASEVASRPLASSSSSSAKDGTTPPLALAARYIALGAAPTGNPTDAAPFKPSSTGLVVPRNVVTEVFSNFADVLSLARVVLEALEDVVPDFNPPSKPLDFQPSRPSAAKVSNLPPSPDPGLSSSTSTASSLSSTGDASVGIDTPSSSTSSLVGVNIDPRLPSPPLNLGKTLLPILPFLKSYSFFITNFSFAISRLSALENDSDHPWRRFCDSRPKRGLNLAAMLLSIVQRIPRYRLMLADIVKYTERDHPDRPALKKAFEIVDNVAAHLESQIAVQTEAHELLDLQRRFTKLDAPIVAPGRRLLKVGHVHKLDRRGNEQDRVLFLFNDLLVYASGGNGGVQDATRPVSVGSTSSVHDRLEQQYCFHRRFRLEDVTVVGADDARKNRFSFEILAPDKSFAVQTASLDEKLDWIDSIRTAKAQLLSDRRGLHLDSSMHEQARARRVSLPATSAGRIPASRTSRPTSATALSPTNSPPFSPDLRPFEMPILDVSSFALDEARSRMESDPLDGTAEDRQAIVESDAVDFKVMESFSAPVWVPDSKAERCMVCAEPFSVWRRRHHCRLCGAVVCWACSTKTVSISSSTEGAPDRVARACDGCFSNVFGESDARQPLQGASIALAALLPASILPSSVSTSSRHS